jgi:hypothetical protein
MTAFLFLNALVCLGLSATWNTNDYLNLLLKLVLFGLGVTSLFLLAELFGYVVKV